MIDQDAINRLTITATQRKLTDAELIEYLLMHKAMAEHLVAQIGSQGNVYSGLSLDKIKTMKAMNQLNADVFQQAADALKRTGDVELAVMLKVQKLDLLISQETEERVADCYKCEHAALRDVLALLRAK